MTTYRQPTLAQAWEERGPDQAKARRSHKSDTLTRIVASLDWLSGKVVFLRSSKVGLAQLVEFYQKLRLAYPHAETIYVVQDNWPVHFHPDVLVALTAQTTPFQRKLAAHWPTKPSPTATRKWAGLQLPIQLVLLPTYASWLNPIEKLWRKLKQELLHLHKLADDLPTLRSAIDQFLTQFAEGSQPLLRYVGLSTD